MGSTVRCGAIRYGIVGTEPVRGRAPVQVTADDGLRAVAISAREHRVVEMAELGV